MIRSSRWLHLIALAAVVSIGAGLAPSASAQEVLTTDNEWRQIDGVRSLARRIIVRPRTATSLRADGLSPTAAQNRVQRARKRLQPSLLRHHPAVDEYVLVVPAGTSERDFAETLLATGDYAYVEPDWLVSATEFDPGDPMLSLQWHHERIGSCDAWAVTPGSPEVVIAICDTGVDLEHPDLAPILVPGYNAVDDLPQADGGDVTPRTDHGTEVAGVAAAVGGNGIGVAGVGLDLRIMPVRVSNQTVDQAFTSDINAGARWAAEQGATVVNASYSNPLSATVPTTGAYIRDLGAIYVWSAGNAGSSLTSSDPETVLIVGASDRADLLAEFSNYGPAVDLVAPGVDIYTTVPGGYGSTQGTSFAAPIVSGVLGLMWSVDPDLTPERAEILLRMTTVDLGEPGDDFLFGAGRIDAAAAVRLARDAAASDLPPVANDDDAESLDDDPVSIDVLANDFEANGDTLTLVEVAPVGTGGGEAMIVRGAGPGGRDTVAYTRRSGFAGLDELDYTVRDAGGLEATATIRVIVDDPPVFDPRVDVPLELGLGPFGPRQTVPADLDGDGDPDLVTCIRASSGAVEDQGVVVLRNDGNGAFTREPGIINTGDAVNWIDAADFNGDGRDDVVVVNELSNTASVLLADADGRLAAPTDQPTGDGPRHVIARDAIGAPLDLDGDGFVDIATANRIDDSVTVLFGKGDGTFEPAVSYGTADGADGLDPWTVSAGDLDEDGRVDLVTANLTGGVSVLRSDGERSFAGPSLIRTPFDNRAGLVVDVDADGHLDLIVSTGPGGESYLGIALGEAGLNFGPFDLLPLGTNANALAVSDVDLDGDLDVVAANQSSADVSIVLNRGDGVFFGAGLREPTGLGPSGISAVDVDGDARPDLVVTESAIDAVAILRNDTQRPDPTDLDGDGIVGFAELLRIIAAWGPCPDCPEDLTGNGSVGYADLTIVLQSWTK